jgi:hypothetical protein
MQEKSQFYVPETTREDEEALAGVYLEEDEADELDETTTIYESFPAEQEDASVPTSVKPSGATSPLSTSMSSDQILEIDPALTGGFTDLAKRAMQRAGAEQSMKTSETSGLSSPPSSRQTEDGEEDAEDPVEDTVTEVAEEFTGEDQIDPTLLRFESADDTVQPPATPFQPTTPAIPRQPTTPATSFRNSQGQEVTPFRIEHPRAATGVIIVQNATQTEDAAAEAQDGDEAQEVENR